jgi:Amidohydrolase family/Tetratricopeptide repeat
VRVRLARWAVAPFLLFFSVAGPASDAPPAALVLTHITVIDATGAAEKPDSTVVIAGNRIVAIGGNDRVRIPDGAQVVDETGRFLIPGLWDMHVHFGPQQDLALFIANGVTGIRIMWGSPEHFDWRAEIDAGRLVGPHLVIASPVVDGPVPYWPRSLSVSSEAQARQAVDDIRAQEADFVKVYQFLPRDLYFAIADEAKKQGLSFEGHVPISVSALEASNAGQKTFEHLVGILPACSRNSDELLKFQQQDLTDGIASGQPKFWGPRVKQSRSMMLDSYSEDKAAALFAVLKRNGTWQCPTLTLLRMFAYGDDSALLHDSRLKYVSIREKADWDPTKIDGEHTADDFAFAKREFQKDLEVVGAMQRAGVGILAGTDSGNPLCFRGFSLHDELGLLVQAGLTPMQSLQAATRNPARFLGREADSGTVQEGKIADLVVLNGDPLADIANTRRIAAVVYGGKLLPRVSLDAMLARTAALAARTPIGDLLFATIQQKGVSAALEQYRELKATEPEKYDFGEEELIGLGYVMIHRRRLTDAIDIFKFSAEVYPNSYNTWDSLAEAYMDSGDKERAISNYQKSLQVNPHNRNAVAMLRQLGAQ